ncbi:MAG: hypothetical protein ACJ75T_02085 [Solirubrobacterales bacterium]
MLWAVPVAHADFGIAPGSLTGTAEEEKGALAVRASSHPFAYTIHFDLNTNPDGKSEGGTLRDILIEAPPGLVGNPKAIPTCSRRIFEDSCPPSTQIGIVRAVIPGFPEIVTPLYNVVPPPGVATAFGVNASAVQLTSLQYATVRESDYGVNVLTPSLPVLITSVTATIWGTPADPGHTPERGPDSSDGGYPSEAPVLPFLTLPADCSAPLGITVKVDSRENPGAYVGDSSVMRDGAGIPVTMTGCETVPFSPSLDAAPTTHQAESAAGLNFELKLPNEGLLTPGGVTETEPEKTEVTLPAGVTVNPSAASGIVGCSEAQFASATVDSPGCPDASKVGTLVAKTPLLDEAIEGSVFLAQPHANKFDSLLALYIVAKAKERGILVKQAGLVQADPRTGQLTTTFDGLPPLPYSAFEFALREGPRAPLITPQFCGTYTTTAKLYPFSAPDSPVTRTAPFTITSGAGGAACASSEAELPAHPAFSAGTTSPVAGHYSPFVFRVSRSDGEQRFSSIAATLPTGLVGKLRGVPYCPEAGIATAASRTAEGGGAEELANPSCPAASQVGVVNVAAGAGPSPYTTQGKAYLAGPYKGAPLSLEIITPAVAGPFDLGSVAVRTALSIGLFDAQIHAQSDPLPTILHGIPLDVRSISLQMDRDQFTLNPTNCSAKTVAGGLTSLTGQGIPLTSPFAVGGCKGLDFQPKLQISLKGGTKRSGHPALKAIVTFPEGGQANIARAQVELPASEFLDQGHIGTVCTQPQLKSQSCPAASIYGKATAYTPLLDKPLTGPVYLGAGFGHTLPDLVADLNGQIRVLAHGRVDTGKKHGIRNTFEAVPDAPISKFVLEMKGGKKGLLVNSVDICKGTHKALVKFTGQNGKVDSFKAPVKNSCGEGKKGAKK